MATTVEIARMRALCTFRMLQFFLFELLLLDGHHIETSCLDHVTWLLLTFFMNLLLGIWVFLITAVLVKLLHSLFNFQILYSVENIILRSEISAGRIDYVLIFTLAIKSKRRFIPLCFFYGTCLILRLAHWKITDYILISVLIQVVNLGWIVLVQWISRMTVSSLSFLYLILDEYFSIQFLLFQMLGLYRILNINGISDSVNLIFILGLRYIHRIRNRVITWLFVTWWRWIKVDLTSRHTQIVYNHVVRSKLTWNQLKGVLKHSFPAECGTFHSDVGQVLIICVKFETCWELASNGFFWH